MTMNKYLLILLIFFIIPTHHSAGAQNETDHASWWIKTYGLHDTGDKMVSRVHGIFNKVNAAADKQSKHFPKLIILKSAGKDNALCLPDGAVILTQTAISACYNNGNLQMGDSKIAFIIAHELAHLSNGDFWQPPDMPSNKSSKANDKHQYPADMLILLNSLEDTKLKEFHADDFAIIYMTMAGYDPLIIINSGGSNFFHQWHAYFGTTHDKTNDTHPPAEQRAQLIALRINDIVRSIKQFEIGIRLYQLGKYKDALVFLESFCEKFPSREVYNNIGLIYYQLGINQIASCDPDLAYRFKLSTFIDTETRAAKMRKPNTQRNRCQSDYFQHAIRYLRNACEKDPFYIPAYINYSSALIMTGQYVRAAGVLRDVMKTDKNLPDALNNFAVALYLMGPDPFIKVDMFSDASLMLKEVIKNNPNYPDACFNLARIQDERGRYAASKENWENFLRLEPSGVFAKSAQLASGKTDLPVQCKNIPFEEKIPVQFGEINAIAQKQLKDFDKQIFKIGAVYCELYTLNDIQVIALDDVIEIVEAPVTDRIDLAALHSKYGNSLVTFKSLVDKKTLLFKRFAVDVQDGIIKKVVHFEERPPNDQMGGLFSF